MANTNGSFGLRPIGVLGSAQANSGMTEYRIAPANTNKIYQGQMVIPLATGVIDAPGAAAGGTVGILGVFGGCEYTSSTTGKQVWSNYWPGAGADTTQPVKAFVYDNPMQLFVIAADASLTDEATARAHVFANANLSTGITGTDATGMSLGRLAVSTINTTNTLNLRIIGFQDDPANSDWASAGIPVIVRLNNHYNSPNGAIAGGTVSTTGV